MIPVILSGGSGTRLWPVSREAYPKQFCEFFDRSFLQNTWERVSQIGKPYVVTLKTMGDLTLSSLQPLGLERQRLLLEPMGKNTAAAVALLCMILDRSGCSDEVVGVFPADHLIENTQVFLAAVQMGEKLAAEGRLVTLGIKPRSASTGFGYIECEETELTTGSGGLVAYGVKSFREKPTAVVAKDYVSSGRYMWNAGIFLFRVSDMIALFKEHRKDLWSRINKVSADLSNLAHVYANMESLSFDHAIAEHASLQACIPCEMGWSDVGSWDEISRLSEEVQDLHLDSKARIFKENSSSVFVYSQVHKAVGLVDVEDLIVVDTLDALLVAKKGHTEKVKAIVKSLRMSGLPMAMEHPFEKRPWGQFEILKDEDDYKLKKILVQPGQKLSYQSHQKRDETWVVIRGQAEFVLDDKVSLLKPGSVVQIPRGAKHRIGNPGTEPLVFVEVQTGDYFGEDDIKRFEDDYQRV